MSSGTNNGAPNRRLVGGCSDVLAQPDLLRTSSWFGAAHHYARARVPDRLSLILVGAVTHRPSLAGFLDQRYAATSPRHTCSRPTPCSCSSFVSSRRPVSRLARPLIDTSVVRGAGLRAFVRDGCVRQKGLLRLPRTPSAHYPLSSVSGPVPFPVTRPYHYKRCATFRAK